MDYKIRYSKSADKDLSKLPKFVACRIVKKTRFFLRGSKPLVYAKKLDGVLESFYRFRVGDYRVVFRVERGSRIVVLVVLRVAHRRDVYDGL